MNLYKFMFYWAGFWALWCLSLSIWDIGRNKWGWAMAMAICFLIDLYVACIGYREMKKKQSPQ